MLGHVATNNIVNTSKIVKSIEGRSKTTIDEEMVIISLGDEIL
jgi:hypothetical protein